MAQLIDDNLVCVTMLSDGRGGQVGPAADVRWVAPPQSAAGLLAQVYANGQLAAESSDPVGRELIVPLALAEDRPAVRVQVVLVTPEERGGDFAALLGPQPGGGQVMLCWPRTNNVESGAKVNVFGSGGNGEIDWAVPLNPVPIDWFPDGVGQWGFGQSPFGESGFGFDMNDQGPPGFGLGMFGGGQLGFDAEWATWLSDPLAAGTYRFAVIAYDELGNAGAASPVAQAVIVPLPPPLSQLAVAAGADGGATISWH